MAEPPGGRIALVLAVLVGIALIARGVGGLHRLTAVGRCPRPDDAAGRDARTLDQRRKRRARVKPRYRFEAGTEMLRRA